VKATAKKLGAATSALAAAKADVQDLRDRIGRLREEREHVRTLPADAAAVARRVDEAIALAREYDPAAPSGLSAPEGTSSASPHALISTFNNRADGNIFAALAAVVPGELKAALLANVTSGGIAEEERARRLAEIDEDEILASMAEEVATREIEDAVGTHVPRRADARAAVLLAPDSELGR
jgi:hypothetical protein